MYIPVTASSKHRVADEVVDAIARCLEAADPIVDRATPADVTMVGSRDAMVASLATHTLQRMSEAHDFMKRFKDDPRDKPVWASSVGMNGMPNHSRQDNSRVGPLLAHVSCRELRTFPSRYKPELLLLHECSVARLIGVVEGDFRDWSAIDAWVDGIMAWLGA